MSAAGGIFAAAREVQEKLSHAGFRSAEDLVVMKVFAGRDQDWVDVGAILARQAAVLDFGLVERELAPLLRIKEDATSLDRLRAIRSRY